MKIKGETYSAMQAAMRAVIEHVGGPQAIAAAYTGMTPLRMLWDLWHIAERNLLYTDKHPGFAGGHWTRVYPHCPSFNLYAAGVNDDHIETALKKIAAETDIL